MGATSSGDGRPHRELNVTFLRWRQPIPPAHIVASIFFCASALWCLHTFDYFAESGVFALFPTQVGAGLTDLSWRSPQPVVLDRQDWNAVWAALFFFGVYSFATRQIEWISSRKRLPDVSIDYWRDTFATYTAFQCVYLYQGYSLSQVFEPPIIVGCFIFVLPLMAAAQVKRLVEAFAETPFFSKNHIAVGTDAMYGAAVALYVGRYGSDIAEFTFLGIAYLAVRVLVSIVYDILFKVLISQELAVVRTMDAWQLMTDGPPHHSAKKHILLMWALMRRLGGRVFNHLFFGNTTERALVMQHKAALREGRRIRRIANPTAADAVLAIPPGGRSLLEIVRIYGGMRWWLVAATLVTIGNVVFVWVILPVAFEYFF